MLLRTISVLHTYTVQDGPIHRLATEAPAWSCIYVNLFTFSTGSSLNRDGGMVCTRIKTVRALMELCGR